MMKNRFQKIDQHFPVISCLSRVVREGGACRLLSFTLIVYRIYTILSSVSKVVRAA